MDHPAHVPCPRGKTRPSKPKGATAHAARRPHPHPETQNPPTSRGMATVKTPSTQNPPGNIQQTANPSQYEAQKPDASAEPSDARLPHHARRSEPPRKGPPSQKPQHAIQRRTEYSKEHPEQKLPPKTHTAQLHPHQPPKNKAPRESAPP
ncbi:hypothetical protein CRENBAI_018022 [Crenichthys baileyi]|uniref:Uncharacterized protein n=1 Tax=Crenichthys baileyi TaxID=28760 RepID=A0AAV9SJ54_9TELE